MAAWMEASWWAFGRFAAASVVRPSEFDVFDARQVSGVDGACTHGSLFFQNKVVPLSLHPLNNRAGGYSLPKKIIL